MDFHLDRSLRLIQPKETTLYGWAIVETDPKNERVGDDQIPWSWTLRFSATSCVLGDGIEIKPDYHQVDDEPTGSEVTHRQLIRVWLRPGSARDDDSYFRETTFRMFGTDRIIKSFELNIYPISDLAEQESCSAWGSVSYTAEADFRNETTEDCVVFSLLVRPETFARYAAKVSRGEVDEMVLSVGLVSGFYSEWSPSISTRDVKVLVGSEHTVAMPPGVEFDPPRLGQVGSAELYINRRLEFGNGEVDPETPDEKADDDGTVRAVPQATSSATIDPQTQALLASLKRATWGAVVLLVLIFVAILLSRQ